MTRHSGSKYGFVHFDERASAIKALEKDDHKIKEFTLQCSWARAMNPSQSIGACRVPDAVPLRGAYRRGMPPLDPFLGAYGAGMPPIDPFTGAYGAGMPPLYGAGMPPLNHFTGAYGAGMPPLYPSPGAYGAGMPILYPFPGAYGPGMPPLPILPYGPGMPPLPVLAYGGAPPHPMGQMSSEIATEENATEKNAAVAEENEENVAAAEENAAAAEWSPMDDGIEALIPYHPGGVKVYCISSRIPTFLAAAGADAAAADP